MEYTFRRATAQDVDGIMEIIRDRIEWMDQEGLHQWNKTNYMQRYPREYFLEGINRGEFYLAISPEQEVSGAIAMLTVDPRWENDELKDCYYLHHLAAKPQAKGAGRALLNFCEELSRKEGKECIRLDCQKGNDKLNDFYASMGYEFVGPMVEDDYEGIKREKTLK